MPVPVKRAQLIDPSDFPFSAAQARAMGQIGEVIQEIALRKIEMQDRIGISNINAAMDNAELEYQKEIMGKPIDQHSSILRKHLNNAAMFASQQKLSPDARELAKNKVAIWSEHFAYVSELATVKALEKDALIRVTADYEKAYVKAGGIESDPDLIDAKKALIEQYAISYTPAEAQQMFDKVQERALKKTEDDLLRMVQSEIFALAATKGYEAALEKADSADFRKQLVDLGISAEKQQTFINILKSSLKDKQAKEAEALENTREQERDVFYKMLEERQYDDIYNYLESSHLEQDEQDKLYQRSNSEAERIARGEDIITDNRIKHQILDDAAAINWPERGITAQDVREKAREARYGIEPKIDDKAYDEIRDAVRRAEEDKIPFTQRDIEKTIGELITGAPSSVLGLPLPTLRTRDDAIKHATNAFGRFVNRIPGVMDTINAKYPPEKHKSTPSEPKDNPAYDFDGELIGAYNPDGSITLNQEGVRRLYEIAGRDKEKARQLAEQNRYVIPVEK